MNKTTINWCDYSWNPITGCNKIAQGCKFCYAEEIANRFWGDRKFTDVQFHPKRLNDPKLRSKKPLKIFVNSMSDLFHERITDKEIMQVFNEIQYAPQHTFLVLTKRIKRANDFDYTLLPNLWCGYSASTNEDLFDNVYDLLNTNAKIKWLSIEPMLEPILGLPNVDWVVAGCESGKNRREFDNGWLMDLIEQCEITETPLWIKQIRDEKNNVIDDVNLFPKELQIRQLPEAR